MQEGVPARHPFPVFESPTLAGAAPAGGPRGEAGAPGLSELQAGTVALCWASFEARGGFLLGDGTGVGKGRTIAGVLRRLPRGARALWVTPNRPLRADAQRDLDAAFPGARIAAMQHPDASPPAGVSVRHATYAALRAAPGTVESVGAWLAAASAAVVVFDEAHVAGNRRTATFRACDRLQAAAPRAHVLYSTATAAHDVEQLCLMRRIGLFGPGTRYPEHAHFAEAVRAHGAAGLELVAVDMRQRGAYVARQLCRGDVVQRSQVVELSAEQRALYDRCARRWAEHPEKQPGSALAFFHALLVQFKVDAAVAAARGALARGMSAVIALQGTGESSRARRPAGAAGGSVCSDILRALDIPFGDLGLPALDPIDRVIAQLGSAEVAEVTGRRTRPSGGGAVEPVPAMRSEIAAFQADAKRVCVLSRAGSTGTSLHADAVAGGGRRRLHVILETPWSSQGFVQQCGRTHRAGQSQPPEYLLLHTDVPSEMRGAARLLRRLRDMSALTRGERGGGDFELMVRRPEITSRAMLLTSLSCWFQTVHARLGYPAVHPLSLPELARQRRLLLSFRTTAPVHMGGWGGDRVLGRLAVRLRGAVEALPEPGEPVCCDNRWLAQHLAESALATLRLVLATCPCANRWLPGRWSKRAHRWFHPVHREAATAILMMAARPGTQFSRLPRDALEHVIAWAMRLAGDRDEGGGLASLAGPCDDMAARNPEKMLNRSVLYPLGVQRRLYFELEGHDRELAERAPRGGVPSLREFVLGARRARSACWAVTAREAAAGAPAGAARRLRVAVRYTPKPPGAGPGGPSFASRGPALYLVESDRGLGEVRLWRAADDGGVPALRFGAEEWERARGLYRHCEEAARARWDAAVAEVASGREARAAALSGTLTVAVGGLLERLSDAPLRPVRLGPPHGVALVLSDDRGPPR